MKPTIGRIVIYKTTATQRDLMTKTDLCNTQDQLPAIVVAVWSDTCVNLKVIQDGHLNDLWITSATQGGLEGQWSWPAREPDLNQKIG